MHAKENFLRAVLRKRPNYTPMNDEAVRYVHSPVVERPNVASADDFMVKWLLDEDTHCGTYPMRGGHPISSIDTWRDEIHLPNLDAYDWNLVKSYAASIDRDAYVVTGFVEMGIFERVCLLLSMEEAFMAFITHPNEMFALAEVIGDYKVELIERLDDAAHLDMLWYGDDWGAQNDLLISATSWRHIIRPHTQRIYDCLKSRGIIINQHSCGKIDRIFPDIVEMGADMWNPCQPCNDLYGMKKQYGEKISFAGGLDSQFVLDNKAATPEDVRAEVRRRFCEMVAPYGGYLAGPSHGVPYEQEKLDAMYDEISQQNGGVIA